MVKSRRSEHADLTRQAILEAAAAAFTEAGYEAASIDDIAATARVTKGAVYHHFQSKGGLFRAVLDDLEMKMLVRTSRVEAPADDPWAAMLARLSAFFDVCLEPAYRRIALEEGPVALGWAEWRALGGGVAQRSMEQGLAALMAAGVIRKEPPDLLANIVLTTVTGAAMAIGASTDPGATRKAAERIVFELLDGLRVGAEREPDA